MLCIYTTSGKSSHVKALIAIHIKYISRRHWVRINIVEPYLSYVPDRSHHFLNTFDLIHLLKVRTNHCILLAQISAAMPDVVHPASISIVF